MRMQNDERMMGAAGASTEVDFSAFLDMIGGNEVVVTTGSDSVDVSSGVGDNAEEDRVFFPGSTTGNTSYAATAEADIGSHSAESTGICSSLLEVISELRKRTKSEGDRFLAASSSEETAIVASDEEPSTTRDVEGIPIRACEPTPSKRLRSGPASFAPSIPVTDAAESVDASRAVSGFARSSFSPFTSRAFVSSPTHLETPRPLLFVDAGGASRVICANCDYLTASLDAYNRHFCDAGKKTRRRLRCSFDEDSNSALPSADSLDYAAASAELRVRTCLSCSREFPSMDALNDHKTKGDDVKCKFTLILRCQNCNFEADQRVDMQEHVFQTHAKNRSTSKSLGFYQEHFKCDLCGFVSSNIRSLKSHMKRHVNDLVYRSLNNEFYACNLCAASYVHLPSLKSHMWKHATSDSYDFAFTNDVLSAAIDFDRKQSRQKADRKLKSFVRRIQTENLQCHVVFGCSAGREVSGGSGGRCGVSSSSSSSGNSEVCAFRTLDRQLLHDHVLSHVADDSTMQQRVTVQPSVVKLENSRLSRRTAPLLHVGERSPRRRSIVVASSTITDVWNSEDAVSGAGVTSPITFATTLPDGAVSPSTTILLLPTQRHHREAEDVVSKA